MRMHTLQNAGPGRACYWLAGMALVVLMSCNTAKRIDRRVAEVYGPSVVVKKPRPTDIYTFTSPLVTADDLPSKTKRDRSKSAFYLFYWRINYSYTTELNPKIAVNQFANAFTTYGNTQHLKEKLNGRTLAITIEKAPLSFSARSEDHTIYLVLGYYSWQKGYIEPVKTDWVVNYTVSGPGGKTGTLSFPDKNQLRDNSSFKAARKRYEEYLNSYKENLETIAQMAVLQIMNEL